MIKSKSEIQEQVDSQIYTLYMVFSGETVTVSKTNPVIKEIKEKVYEVTYSNEKERYITLYDEYELITKEALVADLPYWCFSVYRLVELQGVLYLIKNTEPLPDLNSRGLTPSRDSLITYFGDFHVVIPSAWTKDFIEDLLDVRVTTQFELEYY